MSNGKGAVLAFIGSLLLSVGISGAAGYFLLPRLFPGMEGTPLESHAYVYEEFGTTAQLLDSDTTWDFVPDTEISITVSNYSRIHCAFSTPYIIGASGSLGTQHLKFKIQLLILSIDDKITRLGYWDNGGVTAYREIGGSLYIEMTTPAVAAGTYNVTVAWVSEADFPGTNYLLFRTPSLNYVRSLSALEIIA